ncbi:protein-L-isoaspartate O-methyltransferase [Candidatus Woesearchaeota archaeon]|nr:protein-L-isoaspartate O-methyltransferase [Candidatus Woesearchaeota archaeon]
MALIDDLITDGALRTPHIIRAFREVRREDFLPPSLRGQAGRDEPLPIGHGQTNSQPYTVALMLEWLAPSKGQRVLDVGSGSGWTTALLASITGPEGWVKGTEVVPELVRFGQGNLQQYDYPWAEIRQATGMGLAEEGPYDRILVSAAAEELPGLLLDQLADQGRMVIPIRDSVWVYEKRDGEVTREKHYGFSFVPLKGG